MAGIENLTWDLACKIHGEDKNNVPLSEVFGPDRIVVTLPEGFALYKLQDFDTLLPNVTPWWSPENRYQPEGLDLNQTAAFYDTGWAGIVARANFLDMEPSDYVQETSAIKKAWQNQKYAVHIKLLQPVKAIYGTCQGLIDDSNGAVKKILSGTNHQFYIPGLKLGDVKIVQTNHLRMTAPV